METNPDQPLYPTNWDVRYLCDCKKLSKRIDIHRGTAHRISIHRVHILSDHSICPQKKISIQLLVPSPLNGATQKIIKIVGKTIVTNTHQERFMTEIEFQHFEDNGQKELESSLRQHFNQRVCEITALPA